MSKSPAPADGGALPAESLPTRRAAFGAIASFAALGVPSIAALAAPVDPVFAAIERHKATFAAFGETINPADAVWAAQHGREVTEADEAARDAAEEADTEALEEFLSTVPTTLQGLRAAIAYAVEIDRDCGFVPENGGRIAEALLKSPLFSRTDPL